MTPYYDDGRVTIYHGDCRKFSRYPRWDEIMHARDHLLPSDVGFVMHLPADGEYVALHPTTFHLHQHPSPYDATQASLMGVG